MNNSVITSVHDSHRSGLLRLRSGSQRRRCVGIPFIRSLILICFHSLAFATTPSSQLQDRLNQIKTLQANFVQKVFAQKKVLSTSAGTFYLSRPGRFRWIIKEPMEQQLIADGKKLWIYDVDLSQVTKKSQQNAIEGPAALFLSGEANTVDRDFDVSSSQKGQSEIYNLKAKRPKSTFSNMIFVFSQNKLSQMDLIDNMGQRTQVTFNGIKLNQALSAQLFQFKVPRGVDVVEQ